MLWMGLSSRTRAVYGYGADNGLDADLIGRDFVVIAIGFWKDSLWYYIQVDEELLPVPAKLFSVIDGRLPEDWSACSSREQGDFAWYASSNHLMAPTFEVFYSHLVEGRSGASKLLGEILGRD